MAPSIDYTISSLYCAEDNESIFDDNYGGFTSASDDVDVDGDFDNNFPLKNLELINNKDQNFCAFSRVLLNDECLSSMFAKENHHFCGVVDYLKRLKCGDLDLLARNLAVDWIHKVQSHYNFGPLCFYLSVNYLDRFLSSYELPKGKAWMMQLLSVACISIAAKIDETLVPFTVDLQVCEAKFVFEAKTIQRMELLVMSTLNWRLQSVTPFSFIDYFLYKLSGDQMPPTFLISQATQLISSTIKGIELLEFKPSEIAAAVAICVIEETQSLHHSDIAFPSFLPHQLEKERVMKCVEMIQGMKVNKKTKSDGSGNVPQSPKGVLNASCLSYKSDETSSTPSVSYAHNNNNNNNNNITTPVSAPKRRKLDTAATTTTTTTSF